MNAELVALLAGPVSVASPAAAYLAAQGSLQTRRTYRAALIRLAALAGATAPPEAIPWHLLRYEHAARLKAELVAADLAPATINLHLSVLRGVLQTAWRMGLIDAEHYHRVASIKGIKASPPLSGRALRGVELAALFAACEGPRLIDTRDAAIVALCAGGGLRRAEAAALNRGDVAHPVIAVRAGKGRKARDAAMPPAAWSRVRRWMVATEARHAGPFARRPDDPLILQCPKGGRVTRGRLSPKGLRLAIGRRAELAGIGVVGAHDMRRTFVTDWLGAGVDTITVARAAGHASTDTTARYDRRHTEALTAAAELVPFPADLEVG